MDSVLHHVRWGLVALLGLMSVSVQAQMHCDRVSVSAYNSTLGQWPQSGFSDAGEAFARCDMDARGFVGMAPGFIHAAGMNLTVSSLSCNYNESTRELRLVANIINERRETNTTPMCVSQAGVGDTTSMLRTLTLASNTPGCATRPIAHFQRPPGDAGSVCHLGCRYTLLMDPASNVTNAYAPDGVFCSGPDATPAPPETAPAPPVPDPVPTVPPPGGIGGIGTGPDAPSDYIVDMLAPRIDSTRDAVMEVDRTLGIINHQLRAINTEHVRAAVSTMDHYMGQRTDRIVQAIENLAETRIPGGVPDDSSIVDPTRGSVVQSVSGQTLLSGLDGSGWSLSRSCPAHSWLLSFNLGWGTVDIGPSVGLICHVLAILGWMIGLAGLIQASFILSRIGGGGGP